MRIPTWSLLGVSLCVTSLLGCTSRGTEPAPSDEGQAHQAHQTTGCGGDRLQLDARALAAIGQLRPQDAVIGLRLSGCELTTIDCDETGWSHYEHLPLDLPNPGAGVFHLAGGYVSRASDEGTRTCAGLTHIVSEVQVGCATDDAHTCDVCCGEYADQSMNFYCNTPVSVAVVDVKSGALQTLSVAQPQPPARGQPTSKSVSVPGGERDGRSIAAFIIDETEVTVRAYRECVKAGVCRSTRQSGDCNEADDERLEHPINCVTWCDARAYCGWVGKRLPTAAEWEWVATGRDEQRKYPWGDAAPSCARANYFDEVEGHLVGCDAGMTAAVDARPAGRSRDGVLGLAGNVCEWTADAEGQQRIMQGGSWLDGPDSLLNRARGGVEMQTAHAFAGFRCAAGP